MLDWCSLENCLEASANVSLVLREMTGNSWEGKKELEKATQGCSVWLRGTPALCKFVCSNRASSITNKSNVYETVMVAWSRILV